MSKEAIERVQKYLTEREKSRQIDKNQIHVFHMGDEREALLLAEDLQVLLEAARSTTAAPVVSVVAQPQEVRSPALESELMMNDGAYRAKFLAQPQEAGQARELPRIGAILPNLNTGKVELTPAQYRASLENYARQALAQAAPAVPEGWKHTITRAAECLDILNGRPRPMCRDCADENGICPNGGLDCDMRKLIAHVRAIAAAPSASAQEKKQ